MKHLNKLLLAVLMVLAVSSYAQNSNNPWALTFGVNAVDYRTSAGTEPNWGLDHFTQMFNVSENWNILPSVSYIGLSRSVGKNMSVGLQGSINKITKMVDYDILTDDYYVTNPGDLMYYGIDANFKYSFMNLIKSKVIDPNLHLGGGYTFIGDSSYATANSGGGLTFWFTENVGLALDITYKWTKDNNNDLVRSHFQNTAGIVFQFGGKDTDGDGIYDKEDACPEVAGLKQFNGCPDTDGDGIIDGNDACPDVFGLAALNGCPDTDGDGIADKDDACPDVKGLAAFKGCPDTDGDGIADKDDKCPTVAGPKDNGGCPVVDTDGDGVADKDDACPTVAGPASNKGCPELTSEATDIINAKAKLIYFEFGKATFKYDKNSTIESLEAIKEILAAYPNTKFNVEGYTDSTGSEKYNQKLSEDRANAVKEFLILKGVNGNNLNTIGYGESNPIATNKTAAGRAKNRRTEVKSISNK